MAKSQSRQIHSPIPQVPGEPGTLRSHCGRCRLHAPDESERLQLVTSYDAHILAIDFHTAIEPAHRVLVEAPAQERERGDRGRHLRLESFRHQRRCFVRRKEMPVIDECDEIVPGE